MGEAIATLEGTVKKSIWKIAAHESPRTAKLYDKADDQLTLDGIEKIKVWETSL